MDRKYRTFENRKLLDIYERIILDNVVPSEKLELEKCDIEYEIMLRMEQVDVNLEKKEKKLKCSEIEKLSQEELEGRIKFVRENVTDPDDLLVLSLLAAQRIWRTFCDVCREQSFVDAKDEEKVNFFKEKFPEFFNKYPVIANMMICRGLFSLRAFRQFLIKSKEVAQKTDQSADEKRKNWCHLRAFYMEQTWKNISKSHNSVEESKKVYEEAFKRLNEDYKKFEEEHDSVQEELARTELLYKQEAFEKIIKNLDAYDNATIEDLLKIL